jgi:hypothetical protein
MILTLVLIAAPWPILVHWKRLPSDFVFPTTDICDRFVLAVRGLGYAAFLEGGYAFFWPLFVSALLFCWRRLAKPGNTYLALSIVVGLGATVFVYMGTNLDLAAQLKTSAERVLFSMFIPALLLAALLWRADLREVRSGRWTVSVALTTVAVALVMFWVGLHRKSDEEIAGITISPFPLALSWVWLAAAVITLIRIAPGLRRARTPLIWRATQFAVAVATIGLAMVAAGTQAGEAGELSRRFGGKTLAQQHALTVDPSVRKQLDLAFRIWPAGTHVRVRPKRSLRYHQFYYEAFPLLVVDDSAGYEVNLDSAP